MTSDITTTAEHVPPTHVPPTAEPTRRVWRGGRFSFEALLIVLSVLLGFGVSEWRQAGADRELATRVSDNLRAELEYNLAELDRVLPRHRQIMDLLAAADTSSSAQSGWDVMFGLIRQVGGGVTPPALRQGAWDAAVSTGALRLLDYELVAALSEIYHQQATAVELFGRAVDRYEPALFEPGRQKETVQAFHWMTVELVTLEDGLRERYVEYLSRPPAGAH